MLFLLETKLNTRSAYRGDMFAILQLSQISFQTEKSREHRDNRKNYQCSALGVFRIVVYINLRLTCLLTYLLTYLLTHMLNVTAVAPLDYN